MRILELMTPPQLIKQDEHIMNTRIQNGLLQKIIEPPVFFVDVWGPGFFKMP